MKKLWSKISLKAKVLGLTELVLVVLAVVSIAQVYNLKVTQENMSSRSLQAATVNMGTPLGKNFRLKYNQVQSLALNNVFETKDSEKIKEYLNAVASLNDGYDIILFLDTEGNFVAANTENSNGDELETGKLAGFDFKSQSFFQKAVKEEFSDDEDKLLLGTLVSPFAVDPVRSYVHGENVIGNAYSTVVRNSDGDIIGVLSTRVSSSWIEETFSEMYTTLKTDGYESAELMILDKDSNIVARFKPAETGGSYNFDYTKIGQQPKFDLKNIPEMIAEGSAGNIPIQIDGNDYVAGFSSLVYDVVQSMGWGVVIVVDSKELVGKLEASINTFYVAVAIILLISMILCWFFVDRISKSLVAMVLKLRSRVDVSMETSHKLTEVSEELAAGSTEQAAAVQETVASMTEMTSMINQTSKHVEESENLAMEVNSRTQRGTKIMQDMVRSMETIQQANEELHEMKMIIEEIADKTKVINDIVFKTQLLSFNASIEAARAGQHGRGFAVVAEEVGNLAQTSGNAANEIAELLTKSQNKVEEIVESTKQRATEGQNVSGQAMETFSEIAEEIELIASKIKSIQDATREQEEGVNQVSMTMKQIDQTTQANSNMATLAATNATSVEEGAMELEGIMKQVAVIVLGEKASESLGVSVNHEDASSNASSGLMGNLVSKISGKPKASDTSEYDEDDITGDDDSFKSVS
jgi:methyl-accepting chemotaxis protein